MRGGDASAGDAVNVVHVFAGLPVTDRAIAIDWYSRALGRPPGMLPNDQEAVWPMTETSSLYVVVDPPAAGRAVVTVVVDGLDDWLGALKRRGLDAGPLVEVSGAGRKSLLRDPDGNTLALVELSG